MSISDPQSNPVSLLLVEDNPGDVWFVRKHLQGIDGEYHIAHCQNLDSTMKELATRPLPDAILLDLGLPDSKGMGTIHTVKAAAEDVPIVVLTGRASNDVGHRCIAAGAHDYLAKSEINADSLRRAIGYCLTRRREQQLRELQHTLSHYKGLSTASSTTSITGDLAGTGAVADRDPERANALTRAYRALLDDYLEHLVLKGVKPQAQLEELTTQLGDMGAGPRDVIDLHVQALENAVQGVPAARANAYAVQGRLLALDMMGCLVNYYRVGVRRSKATQEEKREV